MTLLIRRIAVIALLLVIALPSVAQRRKIAVLPTRRIDNSLSEVTLKQVRNGLVVGLKNNQRYEPYTRDLSGIMDELRFQESGVVDDNAIRQLRVEGADFVLVSEVGRTDNGYLHVGCEILNVETGQIEITNNCTMCPSRISNGCNLISKNLSRGISGALPDVRCPDGDGGDGGDGGGGDPPPPPSGCTGVVRQGLVAFYQLDGNGRDCMEGEQNGNVMGSPNYVAGVKGKALHLMPAKKQKFNIPYCPIRGYQSWSICFWLRDFGTGAIFSARDGSSNELGFAFLSSGEPAMVFGSQQYPFSYSARTLQNSGWHHIAIVSDDRNGTILYVDGSVVDNIGRYMYNLRAGKFLFGEDMYGHKATNCKFDNLRFYDRPLDDNEVRSIYRSRQ